MLPELPTRTRPAKDRKLRETETQTWSLVEFGHASAETHRLGGRLAVQIQECMICFADTGCSLRCSRWPASCS